MYVHTIQSSAKQNTGSNNHRNRLVAAPRYNYSWNNTWSRHAQFCYSNASCGPIEYRIQLCVDGNVCICRSNGNIRTISVPVQYKETRQWQSESSLQICLESSIPSDVISSNIDFHVHNGAIHLRHDLAVCEGFCDADDGRKLIL